MEALEIPISNIEVEEGHNPRSDFNVKSIEELSNSIRERGLIQPITVRANPDKPGFYLLIAGERRLRAAQGVLDSVPAVVSNGRSGEADERLVDALIENVQREDISIADEVSGYGRLKDTFGWDAKRIAHVTGFAQNRVTQRMRLLELPEDSIDAAAQLPQRSTAQLVKLASVSKPAAGEVAKWLVQQAASIQSDFAKNPCDILRSFKCMSSFPIMVQGGFYEAQHFQLSADDAKLREELDTGYGVRISLDKPLATAGDQLGAAVELADGIAIGGWEVCCELAARALRNAKRAADEHEAAAEERRKQYEQDSGAPSSKIVVDPETGERVEGERAKEIRSERFKAEQAERSDAIAFNDALGPDLLQNGASLQLTPGVARILCELALQRSGFEYAGRGLRYVHPNGKVSKEGEQVKTKVTKYLEGPQLDKLLEDWITSARKAEDIIGRTMVVIMATRLADNKAVARSNRQGQEVYFGGGIFEEKILEEDLDKLIRKVLPKQLLDRIEERASRSPVEEADDASDLVDSDPGPEEGEAEE